MFCIFNHISSTTVKTNFLISKPGGISQQKILLRYVSSHCNDRLHGEILSGVRGVCRPIVRT